MLFCDAWPLVECHRDTNGYALMIDHPCIFCQIAAGQAPASFVWDDPLVYGMMSLEQPTPYKVLMIPKAHVENLFDLNDELAAALFQATVKVARAVRAVCGVSGAEFGAVQWAGGAAGCFSLSPAHCAAVCG